MKKRIARREKIDPVKLFDGTGLRRGKVCFSATLQNWVIMNTHGDEGPDSEMNTQHYVRCPKCSAFQLVTLRLDEYDGEFSQNCVSCGNPITKDVWAFAKPYKHRNPGDAVKVRGRKGCFFSGTVVFIGRNPRSGKRFYKVKMDDGVLETYQERDVMPVGGPWGQNRL